MFSPFEKGYLKSKKTNKKLHIYNPEELSCIVFTGETFSCSVGSLSGSLQNKNMTEVHHFPIFLFGRAIMNKLDQSYFSLHINSRCETLSQVLQW